MSQFYTRRGDDGTTGVLGEGRVPKYDLRMEALGAIDEATAALGTARAQSNLQLADLLLHLQRALYRLMAEVAATPENAERFLSIDAAQVQWLEARTDEWAAQVNLPREFIVPGDTPLGAALALSRTIVRRAERRVAELLARGDISNANLLAYLNRLSSLCFVLELYANQSAGAAPTLAKNKAG